MTASAPGPDQSPPPARGAPLLITAELPGDILSWADAIRREHYPPERNRLGAHVTLFHGLPPSADSEVRGLLGEFSRELPPEATISGLMDLGRGTAFAVASPAMEELHGRLAERLHGLIQQKDARPLRLHITVQNKVANTAAQDLQRELGSDFRPRSFRFRGLGLYLWDGELWRLSHVYPFRGQR
ncbi:MAG: 2'-5' RNA ligase family protein [Novosphingobium sp.]|nr:2'-5' RNA ligase family protein [Novosphingobium sp.]MCP5400773.1 2'-5' RNA ligase family protein [Novosphingobium sp.]